MRGTPPSQFSFAHLKQVKQVLVGLQFVPLVLAQGLETLALLQGHHVRQLLLVLLGQLLTVGHHFLCSRFIMEKQ